MSQESLSVFMALMIPILSITVSLGALIVWIVVWNRRRLHEADCRHKERMAAIEKGVDLPPDPPQPEQVPAHSRYLLRGLIWLGVGLAITLGGHGLLSIPPINGIGWIPVAVGAAYLIFYLVEMLKGSSAKDDPSASGDERTP